MTENLDEGARIADLEADNRRLRRLLDQRDAVGELRHRLRATLAVLRVIIRKSAATGRSLDDYTAHLEDRLDALARAQAYIDEYGRVELHRLIADELFHYGVAEGDRAFLSGPDVELQPRAGQVLGLAVHELAINSVEHGVLGTSSGRVHVEWSFSGADADRRLTFSWKEFGMSAISEPTRDGFGTEVLTRMLHYELKADTELNFAPEGLRCTISFPFRQ